MGQLQRFAVLALSLVVLSGCDEDRHVAGGSGLLETTEVVVSAETGGRVTLLLFDEGTIVKQSDTLLCIDVTRLDLELTAAEAGRNVAQANLCAAQLQFDRASETETFALTERNRVASLQKSGTATKKQLDLVVHEHTQAELARQMAAASIRTVEAELTKIDAEINRVKRRLHDCYPVAPISGTVTNKYVEIGELMSPGKPIASISRLDSLWVKIYLPTAAFASVKVGDVATIDTESGGKQYQGKVVWTSDKAEFTPKNIQTEKSRANLVYAVKVKVANADGRLKIGMPVYVTLDGQ